MPKFENALQVFQHMIMNSGKLQKQIAMEIRPDLNEKQAKEWLSKCLSPFEDRKMSEEEREKFLDACGNAEHYINYLCDRYGWERPARKVVLSPENKCFIMEQMAKEGILPTNEAVQKYIDDHKIIFGRPSLEIRREEEPKKSLLQRIFGNSTKVI